MKAFSSPRTKRFLISLTIIFLLLFAEQSLFGLDRLVAFADQIPQPFITSPSNDEFMYSLDPTIVKVYEDTTQITVVDLADEDDISYVAFEFSFDGFGWLPIGIDNYGGFEGTQFDGNNGTGSTNGWGVSGWNMEWNLTVFPETVLFLRTRMVDQTGQEGIDMIKIHYDPTPPAVDIDSPDHPATLSGTAVFNVTSGDEDIIAYSLLYLNGSRPYVDQTGLGNADQGNVGTPDTKGTPNTDDDVNNFCGPTAAANAIWRLGQKDPNLLQKSGGGQHENATSLAGEIANDTKTNPVNGTATDDMGKGLKKLLKDKGQDGNYSVTSHVPRNESGKVKGKPTWSDVARALRQGEAVVVLKVKPGPDGIVGTKDDEGHYETAKDAQPYWRPEGGGQVSVLDPKGPTEKSGEVKTVPDNNGYQGIWFDEDGDGQVDPGEVWYLFAFWEVSPKTEYAQNLQSVQYVPVGNDMQGADGWTVSWNTNIVPDGFYLTCSYLTDNTGNVGMNRTTVYINNKPPTPVLLQTPMPENITDHSVTLSWTENTDEDFMAYNVFVSESPCNLGTWITNITDWTHTSHTVDGLSSNTTYYFTVQVADVSNSSIASNQVEATTDTTTLPGDINEDGTVDLYDAIILANAFNSAPGMPTWNPGADLNSDDFVDLFDAIILSNNFGKKT